MLQGTLKALACCLDTQKSQGMSQGMQTRQSMHPDTQTGQSMHPDTPTDQSMHPDTPTDQSMHPDTSIGQSMHPDMLMLKWLISVLSTVMPERQDPLIAMSGQLSLTGMKGQAGPAAESRKGKALAKTALHAMHNAVPNIISVGNHILMQLIPSWWVNTSGCSARQEVTCSKVSNMVTVL